MHRSNGTKVVIGAGGSISNGASSVIAGLNNSINKNSINVIGGNGGGGGSGYITGLSSIVIGEDGGNGCSTNTTNSGGPLDTLPKQFVASMKTLFDILDDQKTGFIKLSDIEKGWQDDGCKGLPHGVINSLRKVTPHNGLLSFERFCAGLKICLLRNQSENRSRQTTGNNLTKNIPNTVVESNKIKSSRSPSAPLLDIENPTPNAQWTAATITPTTTNNTATVRPNNAVQAQRAMSLPQLSPDSDLDIICDRIISTDIYGPPPKPPRSSIISASSNNEIDKSEIRHALQNWQMGIFLNEVDVRDKRKNNFVNKRLIRGIADGGAAEAGTTQVQSSQSPNNLYQKKSNTKKREPRRHTLQNAIDYNMLKRLKQFEEERDILLQGLAAVEKAREWYLNQISNVQDKVKYLGRMGSHMEQWSEAHQERLDLQRARVLELNRHLSILADSWERGGFPLHMNLAVRHGIHQSAIQPNTDTVIRLKQQNHQLTNEISQKSERIILLEREKQSLIHELVQLQRSCDLIGINSSSNTIEDTDTVF